MMNGTLTIRLPATAVRLVKRRAKALGVTPSELVRALLEREMGTSSEEPTALELTRRWVGAVADASAPRGRDARAALAAWNPDRRG